MGYALLLGEVLVFKGNEVVCVVRGGLSLKGE